MEADDITARLAALRDEIRERLAEDRPPSVSQDVIGEPELDLRPLESPRPEMAAGEAEREHLRRANELAEIEQPFELTSDVPLVGPLLTLLRRLAAPLVRPFIDPYVARQERFNAEVVRHLNVLNESVDRRLALLRDSFLDLARDPRLLEARLEAALSDYDTVLRQRHALLFDALEEELWALRAQLRDHDESQQGAVKDLERGVLEYIQAVDARFAEKDDAQQQLARQLERVARRPVGSISESELLATRARLDEAIAMGARPVSAEPQGAAATDVAATGFDAPIWQELRAWMHDQDYRAFQDRFRGDPETLRGQMAAHVERFSGAPGPVADLGCGGGEFLELLGESGLAAIGVEINVAEVEDCRARGLDVVAADLFDWLDEREPGSLGGIFAAQVIEHLPPPSWARLVRLASSRLAPGGRLVLETINPQSVYAMMRAYLLDPTHVRPVPPDLVAFLAARAGFDPVEIVYQAQVPGSERLLPFAAEDPVGRTLGRTIERLNDLLYAPQEYALVAERPSAAGLADHDGNASAGSGADPDSGGR